MIRLASGLKVVWLGSRGDELSIGGGLLVPVGYYFSAGLLTLQDGGVLAYVFKVESHHG